MEQNDYGYTFPLRAPDLQPLHNAQLRQLSVPELKDAHRKKWANAALTSQWIEMESRSSYNDEQYWAGRALIEEYNAEVAAIELELCRRELESKDPSRALHELSPEEEREYLTRKRRAHLSNSKIFNSQAERVKGDINGQPSAADKRCFRQRFNDETLLKVVREPGEEERQNRPSRKSAQGDFKSELYKVMNITDPDNPNWAWCCATRTFWPKASMRAARLFPYHDREGPDSMTSIFGTRGELMSPKNGLLLLQIFKEHLDRGNLVIVPHVNPDETNEATEKQKRLDDSKPKEYKIRVLNPRAAGMGNKINPWLSEQTWRDLDHKPLEFKSDWRPSSRYLYYKYLEARLKFAYLHHSDSDSDQLDGSGGLDKGGPLRGNNQVWATSRPWIRKSMLAALVDEVGDEYGADIMQGAAPGDGEDGEVETDPLLLCIINESMMEPDGDEDEDSEIDGVEDEVLDGAEDEVLDETEDEAEGSG